MDERGALLSVQDGEYRDSEFDQVTGPCPVLVSLLLDLHSTQNIWMSVFGHILVTD